MEKDQTNLQELLQKYVDNTISPAELHLFWKLVSSAPEDDPIQVDFGNMWKSTPINNEVEVGLDNNVVFQRLKERAALIEIQPAVSAKQKKQWLVAASVLVLIVAGFFLTRTNRVSQTLAVTVAPERIIRHCNNCAMLTLSDGSVIELDSATIGTLANQGSANISKIKGGQLAYRTTTSSEGPPVYNKISTPRGGTHQVILSDGTKVWLNSVSSIRFPATFTGNERKVEVTGEVFLEVSPNSNLPFKVSINECEIQVLGTSFNINGYEEEGLVKTTLVDGSIRMNVNNESKLLKPGQQFILNTQSKNTTINRANIDEVTAWKEGYFYFDNVNIQTVLREIGRWYNVNIAYEGKIPSRGFKGELGRDLSLPDVVEFLQKSKVNVTLHGTTLIVKP